MFCKRLEFAGMTKALLAISRAAAGGFTTRSAAARRGANLPTQRQQGLFVLAHHHPSVTFCKPEARKTVWRRATTLPLLHCSQTHAPGHLPVDSPGAIWSVCRRTWRLCRCAALHWWAAGGAARDDCQRPAAPPLASAACQHGHADVGGERTCAQTPRSSSSSSSNRGRRRHRRHRRRQRR